MGPNGSGKSNLSDAIRWVLGEQSAKTLRGGKMEDVIFGGAQARSRQGFAQVTLTLEQCGDLLPDGGEEVAVTRRYYRSGESEYLLNGQSVRLRDVNELFMDTGLGQEGYALIGQGRIDEILSAKSTQRREIFEEAAGISHCRHQKEETQRKLERTQENLVRIGDKLEELDLQRGPLKAQAQQARQYLGLREELRGLEVSLWMAQLDRQREAGQALAADCATAQAQLAEWTAKADALYTQGESLLAQLQEQEARGEILRAQIQQNETHRRDRRQRIDLLRDQDPVQPGRGPAGPGRPGPAPAPGGGAGGGHRPPANPPGPAEAAGGCPPGGRPPGPAGLGDRPGPAPGPDPDLAADVGG